MNKDMIQKDVECPNCHKKSDRRIEEIEFKDGNIESVRISPCWICGYGDLDATKAASERVIFARRMGIKDIFDE